MTEKVKKIYGVYHIEGFRDGVKVEDYTFKNVVTQLFFNNVFALLNGGASLSVSHIATGTGSAAAAKSDTALVTEVFRKPVTSKSYTTIQFMTKLSIAASESVYHIREIGLFCNGSMIPGSGVLISRAVVDIVKNISTQYTITHILTME